MTLTVRMQGVHWRVLLSALTLVFMPSVAVHSYEVEMHRKLTLAAFHDSVMADATRGPLSALGIDDSAAARWRSIPPPDLKPVLSSAIDLVGLGAIYEDHPDPRKRPSTPPAQWRFLRHFFDPQQGGRGLGTAWSSREWLLEREDIPEQEFSLRDAHQFHFDALTRRDKASREERTILLLQSMGRAVHHLQDMTQPAHVRDDAHPPYVDDDFYEKHTENEFVKRRRPLPPPRPCGEAPVDLRQFDEFRKFWTNDGKGIAEFTSRNFVSEDTNFSHTLAGPSVDPRHPFPAYPATPVFQEATLAELGVEHPSPHLRLRFLGLPMTDQNSGGGCFDARATTLSLLSGDLRATYFPSYSLNRFNFEENYSMLFPRAVSFSAGLLNYFFRGRLGLEAYAVVGSLVKIDVRNDSSAQFALSGAAAGAEEFSVYYDSISGERRRLALAGDEIGSQRIEHGQVHTLSFSLPADVDTSRERPFVLVFNGTIGKEPGIAALALGPTQGSFLVTPNYPVMDGVAGARVIEQVEGVWRLGARAEAVAGNVDWRGHDEGEILSWHGPAGRYFGKHLGVSPNIYRGGTLLSVAPGDVIGAAIAKIGAQRYLIAGVKEAGRIEIYQRPYQHSYHKHGMFHSLNNPLGWKLIQTVDSWASSPLFFNASGTEGQVFGGARNRYKISISTAGATVETLSNEGEIRRMYESTNEDAGSIETVPSPPIGCQVAGTVCTGERGQCTSAHTGARVSDVCLAAAAQREASYRTTIRSSTTRRNVKRSVVCADYRGDSEVLCLIEAAPERPVSTVSNIGRAMHNETWTISGVCTPTITGSRQYSHEHHADYNSNTVMMLRVGSRTLPLSGSITRHEKHFNSFASWIPPQTSVRPTVDFMIEERRTEYGAKLLYVDARNEVIAYEEHVRSTGVTGGGAAEAEVFYAGHRYFFDAPLRTDVRSTSRTIVLADREYVLSSYEIQQEPTLWVSSEPAGYHYLDVTECTDHPPFAETYEDVEEGSVYNFYEKSLHLRIDDGAPSFSALSRGVFVASLPIWIRQADGAYVQEGRWNHLSGGDLGVLLPPGAAEARYSPTGIVK